jgi:hypothetical protein
MMFGQEKKSALAKGHQMRMTVNIMPEPEKQLGYVTVHEHRVEVWSMDGTIHLDLQRIGPGHPWNVEEEVTRPWPLNNPACTIEFMEWAGRAQYVSDSGVVPPEMDHGRKREDVVNVKIR